MFEIAAKVFHIVEYFLEIFFYDSEYSCEFDVAETSDDVVSDSVVLVSYQNGELYV